MLVIFILGISIPIQFAAAVLALSMIWTTGKRLAWILIAAAISLMALRRCITLLHAISGELSHPPDLLIETIALASSLFMLIGVMSIVPFFLSIKRSEERLRASSLYTRSLIEASLDPLVTISVDGKIMDVNQATKLATGISREGLIGSDFSDYFTEPGKAKKGYQQVLARGVVRDYSLAIRHKSGRVMDVSYNAVTYKNEAGEVQGVFAAARNITELNQKFKELEDSRRATLHLLNEVEEERNVSQKRAEEISGLYKDLKAVDRMKTEFLAVISHELRTPLTPIKGYISMFLKEVHGKLAPEYIKEANVIKKQSEHLLSLIDSILDVSRFEHGVPLELKKEPVSMVEMLNELIEVIRPQFEARQIIVEVDLQKDFPVLLADSAKLRNLLTNLLDNAVKFTPKGGRIKIVGVKQDNSIEIQVIDGGIGIAKENLKKVFDKFYQVDGSYIRAAGGVGMGLTVAREIVEAHRGKIWAESEGLGKGTKIIFTLPIG